MRSSPIGVVAVIALVVGLIALRGVSAVADRQRAAVPTPFEETFEIESRYRQAGFRFAPAVAQGDREWFLAAVAAARPEAGRLIAEVDGLVEVSTHSGDPFGVTEVSSTGFVIRLDIASLDGERVQDRPVTVLHELGHVIDHALVPADLNRSLDDGIPRAACAAPSRLTGHCAAPEERFADTFAKWALRGSVSQAGAGYGVPTPASLESWGAPLGALSAEVSTRR